MALLVLAVLGAATGLAVSGDGGPGSPAGGTSASGPAPTSAAVAARPVVLAPVGRPRGRPRPDRVASLLRPAARAQGLGGGLIGEVVDLSTGTVLWRRHPDATAPPASTTKLLTATAALTVLGPNHRLVTTVERRGRRLWLVGGGDVTLASTAAAAAGAAAHDAPPGNPAAIAGPAQDYPRPASLAALARRTAAAVKRGGGGPVRLAIDATADSGPSAAPGWKPSYVAEGDIAPPSALEVDEGRTSPAGEQRAADPAAAAGAVFAADLGHDGVRVTGAVGRGHAPSTAVTVASVSSPPVAALVQQLLTNSDNDLAEALARAVARAGGDPGTFAAGAVAVVRAARTAGADTTGTHLVDGSGLSTQDRIRPTTLVSVLRLALSRPDLAPVLQGLPVAGFSGTLAQRYRSGAARPAAGLLRAKTGTLAGDSALAGMVTDRSGDLLGFALLDPTSPGADQAEPALDALAARLASCGCRGGT